MARYILGFALLSAWMWGCGDEVEIGAPSRMGFGAFEPEPEPEQLPPEAPFKVRPGVERLALWGAEPGVAVELIADDSALVSAVTDELGSTVFRELPPGTYQARLMGEEVALTDLKVITVEDSQPEVSFYTGQALTPGFGYLTTRDGTQLSIFVSLPGPIEEGPYPTIVNYSGYSPSQPGESLGGPAEALCGVYPVLCDAPSFPTGILAGILGYATVGVNVRGTGCSGGAYDYFDTAQLLDAYDVIEIVAHQPWVKFGKVGMTGLSFPGITQLFTAAQQPPGLAAIAPMSVIADTGSSTLMPGGIYNNGFALEWIVNVLDKAGPYAHDWIQKQVDAGDTLCAENQLLHAQKVDAVTKAKANPFYTDEVALPVDPSMFVDRIKVPVFLTGQWQDEQTGPHFPALADKFINAPLFRMIATNGIHRDGLSPQALADWATFLSLYVAREAPHIDSTIRAVVPLFMERAFEASISLPPDRFEGMTYEEAKAAFEAEPAIQIIMESGAPEEVSPGAPQGTFSLFFDAWPIPSTVATRWFFQPDGSLGEQMPGEEGGASAFEHESEAGQRITLASGSVDHLQPDWDYRQPTPGHAVSFVSAPLEEDVVMIGHGSVDLWIRSTVDDAELEVGITEVRPDGEESYVQMGWLRASHRALRDDSTELRPVKTHREPDFEPLIPGEWTEVRVEIMPFAHIFRAGSRVRITVDTPGDSMASWRFLLTDFEVPPTHTIGHQAAYPSSVLLPVIPNVEVPTELPECHRLRGQPCRMFVPFENQVAP